MLDSFKNNINWLAQCKRRQYYPIDKSDRARLNAFEYGWKSFNNLYSEIKHGTDREKMKLCVSKYINAEDFVKANNKLILKYCNIDHEVYLADDQYKALNPKISQQVNKLRLAMTNNAYSESINYLLDTLYTVRNARVHGSFGTGKVHFNFLPKIIYTINIQILSGKLNVTTEFLQRVIDEEISMIRSNYLKNSRKNSNAEKGKI